LNRLFTSEYFSGRLPAASSTGQRNTLFFKIKRWSVVNDIQNKNKLLSRTESRDMGSLATWHTTARDGGSADIAGANICPPIHGHAPLLAISVTASSLKQP